MSRVLDGLSWLFTVKPVLTLVALLAVTVFLGAGITQIADQADNSVFLPEDSDVTVATETIENLFGSSQDTISVTLLFRGETLTPDGLAQIQQVIDSVVTDSLVAPFLVPGGVVSPTIPLGLALETNDFASLSQPRIDAAAAQLPLDRLISADVDGTIVAIANVRLFQDGARDGDKVDDEETLEEAQLLIRAIAVDTPGPLEGSGLSEATTAEETERATGTQMTIIIVIALAVIGLLILAFTRSLLDLALSVIGLILTIVWVIGAQGWRAPTDSA